MAAMATGFVTRGPNTAYSSKPCVNCNIIIDDSVRNRYKNMFIIDKLTMTAYVSSKATFFSSPELKAQVSYSDRRLSIVRLSVVNFYIFDFFSRTTGPIFQPELAQIILGERGFKFVQMKETALLQGEIIAKE
jgi:hypothetical protein